MRGLDDVPAHELVHDDALRAELGEAVEEANGYVSRAESIRRFAALPVEFSVEAGYLTPSLKLRREVIARDFAEEIATLYER